MLLKRINNFINRPDVQQNVFTAIVKRLTWRLHWAISKRPYVVDFAKTLKISLPQSGSASLIYYQGLSEYETADFVERVLKPGMTFLDIGAHIGEYTLLAAQLVGSEGKVYAFEPQPSLFPILAKNVKQNGLEHVELNQTAVSNSEGKIEFAVASESSVSSIRNNASDESKYKLIHVKSVSLDNFWSKHTGRIDLIKIDVEGAEKLVFEGAKRLMNLDSSQSPIWLFEYAPTAYTKFDYQAKDLLELLQTYGYKIYRYLESGKFRNFSPEQDCKGIINLVAAKDLDRVSGLTLQNS